MGDFDVGGEGVVKIEIQGLFLTLTKVIKSSTLALKSLDVLETLPSWVLLLL